MELSTTLQEIGFEPREVKIYRALLASGPASIRDIADKAGINRGTTYEVLKTLQHKGVVSLFPKGKRRYFVAEDPTCFLELARERQASVSQALENLQQSLIPQLQATRPAFNNANVHYYEGDEGIELVLKDLLNTVEASSSKEYYVYSAKALRKILYRPFPNYTAQRIKRNLKVRVIALGEGGEEDALSQRKWIPSKESELATCYIAIYPPKMLSISLAEDEYPVAVVIDAPEIALAQKIIFETLWQFL